MDCSNINNNINNNINDNVELYDRKVEHPPADIADVCNFMNEEKIRRMADIEGENHKRVKAQQMSEMFGENMRTTWFQRGSSFVLGLLGSVRSAAANGASNVSSSISNAAGNLGQKAALNLQHKAEEVGNIAIDQAQVLGTKVQQAATDATQAFADKAGNAGLVIQEQAQNLTNNIAHKGTEQVNDLQAKGVETAHSLTSLAQSKALDAKSFLSGKVQEFAFKIKDVVGSSFSKLGSFSEKTSLTFEIMEQEAERTRRMNDIDEILAIRNAMRVAALIKGASPTLYCPTSEPNLHYTTRLLEEAERSRRVSEVQHGNDKSSIDNAKNVAGLIDKKFNNPAETTFPIAESKVEPVEVAEIQKPFVAAM